MTVTMQVQVKAERLDDQYSTIHNSTHAVTSGDQPSQDGVQGNRNPPPLIPASYATPLPQNPITNPTSTTQELEKPKISENQMDYPSFKGVFGWTTIDGVNVPYIFRKDRKFMSVRIVEQKLLSRYPNAYPDELGKHQPLTSYFITEHEANLLNEINQIHCGGEFGQKQFNAKDLIVLLEDFGEFYNLVKKTFPENQSVKTSSNKPTSNSITQTEGCGWIQVNNTVTPFVWKHSDRFVPLLVMKYAAMLNIDNKGILPTVEDCDNLNKACNEAGFKFAFSKTTRLVSLKDVLINFSVHIVDLPSINPLEYAQYLELQQTPGPQMQVPPQQMSNYDLRTEFPHHIPEKPPQQLSADARSRFTNRPGGAPGGPNGQGMHPAFVDPRFMFSYNRFPFGTGMPYNMPYGPPNVTVNPSTHGYGQAMMPPPPYQQNGQYLNNQVNCKQVNQDSNIGQHQQRQSPVRTPSAGSTSGVIQQRSPGLQNNFNNWPEHGNRHISPSVSPASQNLRNNINAQGHMRQDQTFYHPGMIPQTPPHLLQKQNIFTEGNSNQANVQYANPNGQKTTGSTNPYPKEKLDNNSGYGDNVVSHYSGQSVIPPPPNMSGPHTVSNTQSASQIVIDSESVTHSLPTAGGNSTNNNKMMLPNTAKIENTDQRQSGSLPTAANSVQIAEEGKSPASSTQNGHQVVTKETVKSSTNALVESIKGVWLSGKSISCMHLNSSKRTGKFCLVEAVCKLYFSGCSVNEFLFALENVLSIPLATCSDEEEKAFIQYYSLPVSVLKCNKMIDYDNLNKFFPQLTYVFKGKCGTSENQKFDSRKENDDPNSQDNGDVVEIAEDSNDQQQSSVVKLSNENNKDTANPAKRRTSVSPERGPIKQPCRRLEATVQRLLNQQGSASVTST